jgi:hypothetical protein
MTPESLKTQTEALVQFASNAARTKAVSLISLFKEEKLGEQNEYQGNQRR